MYLCGKYQVNRQIKRLYSLGFCENILEHYFTSLTCVCPPFNSMQIKWIEKAAKINTNILDVFVKINFVLAIHWIINLLRNISVEQRTQIKINFEVFLIQKNQILLKKWSIKC